MKKERVVTNLFWRFAERCGAQGVTFIVSIVLARILSPDEFGVVSLVTVFTAILQVFVDSGLGNALIQKETADDTDFSTVFYFNFILCMILYILLFFSAPLLAGFYDDTSLTGVIRVLGLTLIISGVKNIQQAYVSRNLLFKKFFYATLGGTVIAAFVGIILAFQGYGVWALVIQQILNALIDTCILWISVKWRPVPKFSFSRLKSLLSFGWKLLVSSLLETGYNNIRSLTIGKLYSTTDLAYYNKGKQFPNLIVTNINASIDSVLFPVMSDMQNDMDSIKNMTRRAIKTSSYVIWPCMAGLIACAEPLIRILLTEKWLESTIYLQLFCISYAFWPIHTANLNAIKAIGRSDIFLKLELIKKMIGITSLLLSLRHGVFVIALTFTLTDPISAAINAYPNRKLLNYTFKEQLLDLMSAGVLSILMCIVLLSIRPLIANTVVLLVTQVFAGVGIYVSLSYMFRIDSFVFIKGIFENLYKQHGNRRKDYGQ